MNALVLRPDELARIAASDGWRKARVEVFETTAGKVIAKGQREPRHPARYRLLNGLARLLGMPYLKAVPMLGGAGAQAVELDRLDALGATGAGVPRVLHVAHDHFVMQWLGQVQLVDLLQSKHPHAAALWREGGQLLLRVHAAGQYLSQAFARNMIVDDRSDPPRVKGVIDFEDDPLMVMNLPQAQVRDWLAYLHSTLWTRPLPEAGIDHHIDDWMRAESPAVRALFLRACRKLAWLRHLPSQRRYGRDTMALQCAAAAAHRYALRQTPATLAAEELDRNRK